jgi:5'-deoxynucleotidase YfbR-like HD superfamily hydrolase
MKNLPLLFRLLQNTRGMPLYGYALSEVPQFNLSNLAEHHYLVTFIAWQLARHLKHAGAKIDIEKVLAFSLIHDLGELFGGDIAMPYAKANPTAKKLATAFELENQKFLAKYFGQDEQYFLKLANEIKDAKSDEAMISKFGDYMELSHFRLYSRRLDKADIVMIQKKITHYLKQLQDPIARKEMKKILSEWLRYMLKDKKEELFDYAKIL